MFPLAASAKRETDLQFSSQQAAGIHFAATGGDGSLFQFLLQGHMDFQGISRKNFLTKSGPLNPHKPGERSGIAPRRHHQNVGGLGRRLYGIDPGEHRISRKVPCKAGQLRPGTEQCRRTAARSAH